MVDLEQYPDSAVLSTREAVQWLELSNSRALVALGVEPLPIRGRQYRWSVRELRRAVMGLPPQPREEVLRVTPVLALRRAAP